MSNNTGIYKITNTINNKVYVGQSRDLKRRFTAHKRELKNNEHVNSHLQFSFNKYGEEMFVFEVIEYCSEVMLNQREHYWVLHFNSHNRGYGYNAVLPKPNNNGFYHSEESKRKLSEAKTVYSKEELMSYLQDYYYHFGKVPTTRDLDDNSNFPSSGTYEIVFGNYKNALIESDLYDFVDYKHLFERPTYSKEDILTMFIDFINKYNRFPNHKELKKPFDYNLPSEAAISRHFSGRNEIREILNYVDVDKNKEKQESLEGLYRLYKQDGKVTSRTIDKSPLTRSTKYYSENFGSLVNAYELAGIKNYKFPNNVTKELHNNKLDNPLAI